MKITIDTIPHDRQRYPTVGDWIVSKDQKEIRIFVSDMRNWKYELLVGIHELAEVLLCLDRDIPQDMVDKFDKEYEHRRSDVDNFTEPGDDSHAPYRKEHFFATNIERLLAAELRVDWKLYEDTVNAL